MDGIDTQTPDDLPAISGLMAEAFGPDRHQRSVWNLRTSEPVSDLCLVMRERGECVGSLRFWQVMLGGEVILLLGPLAISPERRGQGMGMALIEAGIERASAGPWELMLVSGEVDYYPRFGFVPAAPYDLEWPGFIEPERLQLLELKPGALAALDRGPLAVRPHPG